MEKQNSDMLSRTSANKRIEVFYRDCSQNWNTHTISQILGLGTQQSRYHFSIMFLETIIIDNSFFKSQRFRQKNHGLQKSTKFTIHVYDDIWVSTSGTSFLGSISFVVSQNHLGRTPWKCFNLWGRGCNQLIGILRSLNNMNNINNIKYSILSYIKDLSLCHELRFSNPYIFATQCRRL